jgi:ABC-2 type transport system ATP-binding protein
VLFRSGTIRILDPEKEGVDLLQILDWAEANLPWLAYRDGNLVLGAIGGSYGGGYQHLIYAIDPKRRLDAIAPEITWHDLRYSLASGPETNVFKSYWGTLLSVAGNVLAGPGSQDAEVNEGLVQGLTLGELPEDKLALLYKHSLASYCEGQNPLGGLSRIDALYWQSSRDTLFNLNDAWHNYQCVSGQGGDVRLLVKAPGHDGGGSEQCDKLGKDASILAWFDEKLKRIGGRDDYIPKFCFHLGDDGDDGVVTGEFPIGGTVFEVPAQILLAQTGSPQAASVVLTTVGPGGAVLAGIPTATVEVADPTGAGLTEPVLFLALAKRAAGANQDTLLMGNQVRPLRGYGSHSIELVGVTARLAEGEELRLVIQAGNSGRYPGMGSRVGAPASVSARLSVPLLPASLPAPPAR